MTKTESQKAIEQYLSSSGLKMFKQISSGGFFTSPTYDRRTVYTMKDLNRLNKEGFIVSTDLGAWLFNALNQYEPPKKVKEAES